MTTERNCTDIVQLENDYRWFTRLCL